MGRNLACHTAQKEATRMSSHASRILVAISLASGASLELLSRGIELLARPNDIIVALHVLGSTPATTILVVLNDNTYNDNFLSPVEVGKVENGLGSNLNRFRKAKASVISILGELMEASIAKQVRLEAKVRSSSSIGKGIEEEAILLDADFLLLGGTRRSLQNSSSYLIAKQCLKNIPESCSVVAMGRRAPHSPPQNPYSFSTKKLARSKDQKKQYSSGEGFCCESSPASTMDLGSPELRRTSAIGFHVGALSRANVWRRISMPKFLSLFRSEEELQGRERRCEEDDKPSWGCFSHDEISCATNNFHLDNLVGRGGHSEVFKGTLGNGIDIAVKRLSKNSKDDKEKKFLEELGILGHISHPNTSSLIGCCFENGFHLIFNFCPNGSLSSALHGQSPNSLDIHSLLDLRCRNGLTGSDPKSIN
ncbi:putative receptor-like serine/threonine-protein kinase [Apostasia shenzhenica]|uniref:Putative receptor-like serine/threonine-protein kinase n=1 Tax=Apostasia shenzhenica TaxID=1088818 RepID=A0A2I0ASZ3_9ASPA|nr:putative receptor-like serine/threonine-protein kinase [Apostasia shenzhenica]